MADLHPGTFSKVAQQQAFQDPSIQLLLDRLSRLMFNKPLSDLDPTTAEYVKYAGYIANQNFNGKSNSGAIFQQLHQGIVASGSLGGFSVTNSAGGQSKAYGAGVTSMGMAQQMTSMLQAFYADKNGHQNYQNTKGLGLNTMAEMTNQIMAERGGFHAGDVVESDYGYGAAGLEKAMKKAQEQGVSKDSQAMKGMVNLYRVTREREKVMDTYKGNEAINELQKKVDEKKAILDNGGSLSAEEQEELRANEEQLQTELKKRSDYADKQLKGKTLKGGEEINGVKTEDLKIGESDLSAAKMQEKGMNKTHLITGQLEKDIQEAIKAQAGNVRELSKIFGTDSFSELQEAANKMGLGSLTAKNNVMQIRTSIDKAKAEAKMTGRTVAEVMAEQGDIATSLAKMMGVDTKYVNNSLVQKIQEGNSMAVNDSRSGASVVDPSKRTAIAVANANYDMEENRGELLYEEISNNDKYKNVISKDTKKAIGDLLEKKKEYEEAGDMQGAYKVDQAILSMLPKEARESEELNTRAQQNHLDKVNSRMDKQWGRQVAKEMTHRDGYKYDKMTEDQATENLQNLITTFGGNQTAYERFQNLSNVIKSDTASEAEKKKAHDALEKDKEETIRSMRKAGASEQEIAAVEKAYQLGQSNTQDAAHVISMGRLAQENKNIANVSDAATKAERQNVMADQYFEEKKSDEVAKKAQSGTSNLLWGMATGGVEKNDSNLLLNEIVSDTKNDWIDDNGNIRDGAKGVKEFNDKNGKKGTFAVKADWDENGALKDRALLGNKDFLTKVLGFSEEEADAAIKDSMSESGRKAAEIFNNKNKMAEKLKSFEQGGGSVTTVGDSLVISTAEATAQRRGEFEAKTGKVKGIGALKPFGTDIEDIKTDENGVIQSVKMRGERQEVSRKELATRIANKMKTDPEFRKQMEEEAANGNDLAKDVMATEELKASAGAYAGKTLDQLEDEGLMSDTGVLAKEHDKKARSQFSGDSMDQKRQYQTQRRYMQAVIETLGGDIVGDDGQIDVSHLKGPAREAAEAKLKELGIQGMSAKKVTTDQLAQVAEAVKAADPKQGAALEKFGAYKDGLKGLMEQGYIDANGNVTEQGKKDLGLQGNIVTDKETFNAVNKQIEAHGGKAISSQDEAYRNEIFVALAKRLNSIIKSDGIQTT